MLTTSRSLKLRKAITPLFNPLQIPITRTFRLLSKAYSPSTSGTCWSIDWTKYSPRLQEWPTTTVTLDPMFIIFRNKSTGRLIPLLPSSSFQTYLLLSASDKFPSEAIPLNSPQIPNISLLRSLPIPRALSYI